MQNLFVLSSPWPILLTYIDIDGIARLLFCSLVFFFLIYMLLKCYYPIPANLSINQCYGQLSPEKAFCTSIINMRTYIYLCVTIFVLQFFCLCQTKRLQKGYRKENKTTRLLLIRFQSMMLLNNYRTVARNLGLCIFNTIRLGLCIRQCV